ncbi:glycosyltransferase family 4 protein [Candidatus Uhrbacteria bacterium]|nr:glycosyltransferase family 4 protein [Candidatus Uhrbacteria bacterium]
MKIIIATGIYPPDIGGPAQYSKKLREHLLAAGHEVVVVSYGEGKDNPEAEIYKVSRRPAPVLRHFFYFLKVWRAGRSGDIIFAQDSVSSGLPALLAAKLARKYFALKMVGDYAWEQAQGKYGIRDALDDFQTKKYGLKIEILKKIEKYVASSAELVIVPSKYLQKIVLGWGVYPFNVKVIYNAVLGAVYPKPTVRGKPKTILSAGRLVPWKGFEELIFAMREVKEIIPDAQLVIAGDGPERAKLENLVLELGLEGTAHLPGKIPHNELPELYLTSRAFVLNTAYEGFSHQLIEVMAAGLPLATTCAGGNAELVSDGENAVVFAVNDVGAIKEAMVKLLTDDKFAESMAERAQEKARGFTEERTFKETETALGAVLLSKRAMIISLDASVLESDSPSFRRMLNYALGANGLVVLVLGAGSEKHMLGTNLYVHRFGGSNKISAFVNTFFGGKKLVKSFRPHIISAQDPFFTGFLARYLAKKNKAKLIAELHGDFWPKDKRLHPHLFRNLIAGRILRRADAIRIVSQKAKEGMLNKFLALKSKHIEVFPVVSGEIKSEPPVKSADKYPEGAIRALFVGRLTKEKGLDWFLPVFAAAAKQIPLYLRVVGDGMEAETIKGLTKDLDMDSRIDFVGTVSEALLDNEYRTADFLVLPSRQESWGRVIVEALQRGCPVVATSEVGAAHDFLKDGENALVVPFGNSEAMRQALMKMALQEDLRKRLAEAGRISVSGLSSKAIADKMNSLWKTV